MKLTRQRAAQLREPLVLQNSGGTAWGVVFGSNPRKPAKLSSHVSCCTTSPGGSGCKETILTQTAQTQTQSLTRTRTMTTGLRRMREQEWQRVKQPEMQWWQGWGEENGQYWPLHMCIFVDPYLYFSTRTETHTHCMHTHTHTHTHTHVSEESRNVFRLNSQVKTLL